MWIIDSVKSFIRTARLWFPEKQDINPDEISFQTDINKEETINNKPLFDTQNINTSPYIDSLDFFNDVWKNEIITEPISTEVDDKTEEDNKFNISNINPFNLGIGKVASFIWDKFSEADELRNSWQADNIWEWVYWTTLEPLVKEVKTLYDWIKLWREGKQLQEDVLEISVWWDISKIWRSWWWVNIDWNRIPTKLWWKTVPVKEYVESYSNAFQSWLNSSEAGNHTLEDFQLKLKESWFSDALINSIEKDELEEWLVKYFWGTKELNESFWLLQGTRLQRSMTNIVSDELWSANRFNSSSIKSVLNSLDTFDIEEWDLWDFKQTLLNDWVNQDVVDKLNENNVSLIKNKINDWKTENWITEIKNDWWYIQIESWYKNEFDWEWNLLSSDYIWWTELSSQELELNKIAWTNLLDPNAIKENLLETVRKTHEGSDYNQTELTTVWADAYQAFSNEINDQKDHLLWTMELIKKERREWNEELANKMEKELRESAKLFNIFQQNVYDLTKIKIENKLVWRDLEKYIYNKYWVKITQFMKKDGKWWYIDTNGWAMADYIINKQVDINNMYYMQSDNVSDTWRAYHAIVWTLDSILSPLKKPFTRIMKGTVRAQIEDIGAFDPVPWRQPWELWRRTSNKFFGISDEALSFLAPEIIKVTATWWTSLLASWVSWLSKLSKITWLSNVWYKLSKTSNYIKDINKATKWIISAYKWDEVNTLWLWINYILNWAKRATREMNIEVQSNRIDPERWDEFNTNLAAITLVAPWFFDAKALAKSFWLSDWISHYDVLKSMTDKEVDWWRLKSVRDMAAKNLKDLSVYYETAWARAQRELKLLAWNSLLAKKTYLKSAAINSAIENPVKVWLTNAEVMWTYLGKGLKDMGDKEIVETAAILKQIIEDPTKNLADVIKVVENLPWRVTLWKISSTVPDSAEAIKKLSTQMTESIRNWEMFPVKYVGDDVKMSSAIQNVFWGKFLPSRVFTKWDIAKASGKAKWTFLESIFDEKFFDTYWEDLWNWKFTLTSQGKRNLWVIEQPTKSWIANDVGNWNIEALKEKIRAYLWNDYEWLVMDWEIINNISKVLSDTIC